MRLSLALVALLALPVPVFAQEDPMEVQRCVWACLRNEGGSDATSPAYAQCVADRCESEEVTDNTTTDISLIGDRWDVGQSDDGRPVAQIEGEGEDGTIGLYYQCTTGKGQLILFGLNGPGATLRMVIGQQAFDVTFRDNADLSWVEADVPPRSALLTAMQSGNALLIRNDTGRTVLGFSLQGSTAAIQSAMSGC